MARSHARHRFLILDLASLGSELAWSPLSSSTIPLLFPRVGMVVVAAGLPEAGLVVLDEPHAGEPLRALPEVEVRNQAADRSAVIERERLAVDPVGDHRVVGGRFLQRDVR